MSAGPSFSFLKRPESRDLKTFGKTLTSGLKDGPDFWENLAAILG